jgi:lipid A 3-O-deacylase
MICELAAGLACLVSLSLREPVDPPIHRFSAEVGNGGNTEMWRVGAQRNWRKRLRINQSWQVGGYWDLAFGAWYGRSVDGADETLLDVGLTPVFRLEKSKISNKVSTYLEAAVGFHLLSKDHISNRRLGEAFQFGDHVGLGVRFGSRGRYDVSYRLQHLSNAGLARRNRGINFNQIRFSYHFR